MPPLCAKTATSVTGWIGRWPARPCLPAARSGPHASTIPGGRSGIPVVARSGRSPSRRMSSVRQQSCRGTRCNLWGEKRGCPYAVNAKKKTGRYLAGGGILERVFWTMAMPKSWSPANSGGRLPRMGPSVTVPGVPFAVTWKAKGASLTGRAVAFRDAGLEAHGFAGNATRRSAAARGKVPKGHWRP